MVRTKERYEPAGLPYDYANWADRAWLERYEQLWDEARVSQDPGQTDRLLKHLKNTEFDWLQQIMFRYNDGLDMRELVDQRVLMQRLNIEQGRDADYHTDAL